MDLSAKHRWICCQVGAREHYAVPRALAHQQNLFLLLTDAWVYPNSIFYRFVGKAFQSFSERYHDELQAKFVQSYTNQLLFFEFKNRLRRSANWTLITARNRWFQRQAIQSLQNLSLNQTDASKVTVFAYSYAALEIFRYAKSQGWKTVLGQIDPGPVEERIVAAEHKRSSHIESSAWKPAPSDYWSAWQQECELADRIFVNSTWSRCALEQERLAREKIRIVPLAYEKPHMTQPYKRIYPASFSRERPLRVLFLGQLILRKGISYLLEAAAALPHKPIEFWLVGLDGINIRSQIKNLNNCVYFGSVPRGQTYRYYQEADMFIFPTLSDGFGLTQLEAQSWQLPVIASRYCGDVVRDGLNGVILPEVSSQAIIDCLETLCDSPQQLSRFSAQSVALDSFSFSKLADHFHNCF